MRVISSRRLAPAVAVRLFPVWRRSWKCTAGDRRLSSQTEQTRSRQNLVVNTSGDAQGTVFVSARPEPGLAGDQLPGDVQVTGMRREIKKIAKVEASRA